MLVCAFFVRNCTRDRGCSVHPVFPAPSVLKEGERRCKPRACRAPRGRERTFSCRHPRRRVTQYSRDVDDRTDRPRRTGCPAFAGHDGPVCLRRPAQAGADAWTPVMLYYNVCPMPHDHSHDHGHHHGHAHSHGPATPHPAQAAPWSILRMTVLSRLAAALAVSAALWAVVLVAMR